MFDKLWNFFMYGSLISSEDMCWDEDSWQGRRLASRKNIEKNGLKDSLDVAKEDKKALYIAALSVFGPVIGVLLVLVVVLLFVTAKFF